MSSLILIFLFSGSLSCPARSAATCTQTPLDPPFSTSTRTRHPSPVRACAPHRLPSTDALRRAPRGRELGRLVALVLRSSPRIGGRCSGLREGRGRQELEVLDGNEDLPTSACFAGKASSTLAAGGSPAQKGEGVEIRFAAPCGDLFIITGIHA